MTGLTFDNSILCLSPSTHQRSLWGCCSDGKCMSPHTNVFCYFLEILVYIDIRFSRFLKVTFDSFSSSAPSIKMPGRHGREAWGFLACVFNHHPPWLLILMAPDPHGTRVSHTRSPSLLRFNLLLIPKVSIQSEQIKFCFSQNTFFPNTYRGISWMALPPAPLTSVRGHAKNDS